ncbi:hypothetical protein [Streptomyces sp. NBC_00519]|uniref:hypothetical protein n=1 Tax=Streptomyces sp. NBC_00519 TaxID=2975764 RepID=UPI0030E1D649
MRLLQYQGARWAVRYKVWTSKRAIKKMLKQPDISQAQEEALRKMLAEADNRQASAELARVMQALDGD